MQHTRLLITAHIPYAHALIIAAREHELSVRRKRAGSNRATVPAQRLHGLTARRVPHANSVVFATAQHELALWRERYGAHRAIVPGQSQCFRRRSTLVVLMFQPRFDIDRLHVLRLPEHHELVVTPAGDHLAVRREARAIHRPVVTGERRELSKNGALRRWLLAFDEGRIGPLRRQPRAPPLPCFPYNGLAILPRSYDPFSIRREVGRPDPPAMAFEHLQRRATGKIPHARRVIVRAAYQLPAIRRETHTKHAIRVPRQRF